MVTGKSGILVGLSLIVVLMAMPVLAVSAGWQWIAPQRVAALLKEGSGLWLVDVRSEAAFATGHIEGAVHIPAALLATKHLPQEKIIVLVDDSLGVRKGRECADALLKKGYAKVFVLSGGLVAWQSEGYTVAGKEGGRIFPSVMSDEIQWAQANRLPLKIFDLRDKDEQARGPVAQAQPVEGKSLAERVEKVKELIGNGGNKGLAAKLEKPATTILVFPTVTDPRPVLERSFQTITADIRFLEGGYAAWAAKPDKEIKTVGACPTCPGGASGGKR